MIRRLFVGYLCLAAAMLWAAAAIAADPIIIGLSAALTGPIAVNGKPGLMAMQIWEKDVNDHGGLLGRPVKLDYCDDQSNPANIPAIYSKLIEVDKADFLVGMLATGINDEYKYPR